MRMVITLSDNEATLLARWAATELREPRDQVRFLIRRALAQHQFVVNPCIEMEQVDQRG